jgi:uncharacterized membrane protein
MLKELLISSLEGAGKSTNGAGQQDSGPSSGESQHHGGRGLAAAGLGAAALAPMAFKGLERLAREAGMKGVGELVKSPGDAVQGLGGKVTSGLEGKVSDKVDEAGGPGGILSDAVKGALPFGGGGGDKGGGTGVGKGRRMPVQQSIDIGVPIETVYNQWTQYEEWPKFMHRVVSVSQEDEATVKITVKMWTRTREFTAQIETQRPDERVKWKVSEGIKHVGVVTFHELTPNLTRVLLSIDVDPGGMIEKMARGMRHVKRAARGDLHRFKAFIELAEEETGAWRGVIEDGEVVEDHDPEYDKGRDYSDADEVLDQAEDQEDDDSDDNEEEEDEQPRAQRRRRQPSSKPASKSSSKSRSSSSAPSRKSSSASARKSSGSSSRNASGSGSSRGRSKSASASSRRSSSGSGSGRSRRARGDN